MGAPEDFAHRLWILPGGGALHPVTSISEGPPPTPDFVLPGVTMDGGER